MVYFISRNEYEPSNGKRLVTFPQATLLEWFQAIWVTREDLVAAGADLELEDEFDPYDWVDLIYSLRRDAFGGKFYGLTDLFLAMPSQDPPTTMSDVAKFISSFERSYGEGTIEMVDSAVQAQTDDDEIDLAWYVFDSDFAQRHQERVAFLLHEPFELPTDFVSEGWIPAVATKSLPGNGVGATYCCFCSSQDGMTITEIEGCYRLPARLPELGEWLAAQEPDAKLNGSFIVCDWPPDLILLRALVLETGHLEHALREFSRMDQEWDAWLPRALADYSFKHKDPLFLTGDKEQCKADIKRLCDSVHRVGDKSQGGHLLQYESKPRFQFTPHLVQEIFSVETRTAAEPDERHCFSRLWIFFDDLWAAAHKDLAESILRYGQGMNVLGPLNSH